MKQLLTLLLAALFCIAGGSCQKKEASELKHVKQIRLNIRGEPATLDPRKGGDLISSELQILLFEGLTRLNPDGSIELGQAKAIEISYDKTVYTFHLRETYWSNGKPVTAYDFEKAWMDILDPHFPSVNAYLFYPIKNAEAAKKGKIPLSEIGIHAIDNHTLVVTLEKPTPYFLKLTSFCGFCPISKEADQHNPKWSYNKGKHFVTNGPYILKEWKHNNQIVLTRNPYYWEKEQVLSDTIHLSMVANATTALEMFEKGQLDMIGNPLCDIPVEAALKYEKKGELLHKPVPYTAIIAFNAQQFPFSNRNLRKAFSYAINRQEIVENITQLNEQVALNAIPPILKNSRYRKFFEDHAEQQAKGLFEQGLQELGIKKEELREIVYYYSTSDANYKMAQALQQQWQNTFGIPIKLCNLDYRILMNKLTKKDFTLAQCAWVAQYNDQISLLERFKFRDNAKNYAGWENPTFIRLLDQSAYETPEERIATLEQAEELFLQEMPIAPIYHGNYIFLVQPKFKNLALSPSGDLYFNPSNLDQTAVR